MFVHQVDKGSVVPVIFCPQAGIWGQVLRFLCSQMSTRGTGNVKDTVVPSAEGMCNLFPTQSAGSAHDLCAICVAETTPDPLPDPYLEPVSL